MKVRTQQNFNRKTNETVFGISIMPDGGRRYCKYPIGPPRIQRLCPSTPSYERCTKDIG